MVDASASFEANAGGIAEAHRREAAGGLAANAVAATEQSLATYAKLAEGGVAAPAQTAAWVQRWVEEVRPDAILATLTAAGRPVLSLALEVERKGPFKVARFMSGRHANGNFPAADAGLLGQADAGALKALISAIGHARPDVDLVALERLMPDLDGVPNPLMALPHSASPNIALGVDLDGGFEALLGRASGKRKRKKHRSQTRKFEAAGGFARIEAKTPAEVDRLLDAFFAMKEFRFAKMGIANVFGEPAVRAFFRTLFAGALGPDKPEFVLHGLEVNGRLRAVTGSSRCGKRLVCEFGAIAEDDMAHTSPGDFLFFENIGEACEDGYAIYDFSVGDQAYKRLWCDLEIRHADVLVPLTVKGRVLALALSAYARAKAAIKGSPLLWKLTKLARKRAAGQAPAAAASDD